MFVVIEVTVVCLCNLDELYLEDEGRPGRDARLRYLAIAKLSRNI